MKDRLLTYLAKPSGANKVNGKVRQGLQMNFTPEK